MYKVKRYVFGILALLLIVMQPLGALAFQIDNVYYNETSEVLLIEGKVAGDEDKTTVNVDPTAYGSPNITGTVTSMVYGPTSELSDNEWAAVVDFNGVGGLHPDTYTVYASVYSETLGEVTANSSFVLIADPNLEEVIRTQLGKPTGEITIADLESLTELDAVWRGITDLSGLEYATNLSYLNFAFNDINDISPLQNLGNINELILSRNQISDISILQNLINLQVIDFEGNHINDIAPLQNLTNLYSLNLGNNQISDITALQNLTNLQQLYLWNNQISDITALQDLTNISVLWLTNNQVSDITPLQYLVNLQELWLENNQISDITALQGLTNLRELWLISNKIRNITPLENMTNLEGLHLYDNLINNIYPLQTLSNLVELDLSRNIINNINALKNLTNMATLHLNDNYITDITPLVDYSENRSTSTFANISLGSNLLDLSEGSDDMANIAVLNDNSVVVSDIGYEPQKERSADALISDLNLEIAIRAQIGKQTGEITIADLESLTELDATGMIITSLSGLEYATNLTYLELTSNMFSDITPIGNLTQLQTLIMWENWFVDDFSPLQNLTNLKELNLGSTSVTDLSFLQNLTNLQTLVLSWSTLSDLSELQNLTNLQTLYIQYCTVNDVTPLQGLSNLQKLNLAYNMITDVSAIQNLVNLQELDLDNNQIINIPDFHNLINLKKLNLSDNLINDISGIRDLTNLQELNLGYNQITDIAPLIINSQNGGLGTGDSVSLEQNRLELIEGSEDMLNIQMLIERGVSVTYEPQQGIATSSSGSRSTTPKKDITVDFGYIEGTIEEKELEDGTVICEITLDVDTVLGFIDNQELDADLIIDAGEDRTNIDAVVSSEIIKALQEKGEETLLTVKSGLAEYRLSVEAIDLEEIKSILGSEEDINISIVLKEVSEQVREEMENIASKSGMEIISECIEFKIEALTEDEKAEISGFKQGYVTKIIKLEKPADVNKAVVVVYDETSKTFKHVPAKFFEDRNGNITARAKNKGNSAYAVIQNTKTFDDINAHWAKKDIETLASKLVISGITEKTFAPDQYITRAQFAALLVRALGLDVDTSGISEFNDVTGDEWFAGTIKTAVEEGLVQGYDDGTFKPDKTITRQEMAVMIARALDAAENTISISDTERESLIKKFIDASDVKAWADSQLALAVKAGIIKGKTGDNFMPDDNATRAEAVTMLIRMMRAVEFIN